MRSTFRVKTIFVACLTLPLLSSGVRAHDKYDREAAAVAAAAIIGIAALAHNHHHHKDGQHLSDAQAEADYERGYNDGLYAAPYSVGRGARDAYDPGYNAGVADRAQRVSHTRADEWAPDRHSAPTLAMKGCVGRASEYFGVRPQDIYPVASRGAGSGEFKVEVVTGYSHAVCIVAADGNVSRIDLGKL